MNTIQVKEIHQVHGKASMSVPEDTALDYVVALFGHERHLQGVFRVDSNGKFVGMVSRFDLLRWAQLKLYGGEKIKKIPVNELLGLAKATKARDLETDSSGSFSLKEDDTLQTALDLMVGYEEDIIPVLDSEGKIIGDVSLSELLSKALEVGIQPT
ncbi:HPP family protein [Chloroflexota bacterium]